MTLHLEVEGSWRWQQAHDEHSTASQDRRPEAVVHAQRPSAAGPGPHQSRGGREKCRFTLMTGWLRATWDPCRLYNMSSATAPGVAPGAGFQLRSTSSIPGLEPAGAPLGCPKLSQVKCHWGQAGAVPGHVRRLGVPGHPCQDHALPDGAVRWGCRGHGRSPCGTRPYTKRNKARRIKKLKLSRAASVSVAVAVLTPGGS